MASSVEKMVLGRIDSMKKPRSVGIFTWLAALDALYWAVEDVINKTVGHPRLPSALVKLRKAQRKLACLQAELEVVKR